MSPLANPAILDRTDLKILDALQADGRLSMPNWQSGSGSRFRRAGGA